MYINNEKNYIDTKTNVRLKTNWIQLYGHLQVVFQNSWKIRESINATSEFI